MERQSIPIRIFITDPDIHRTYSIDPEIVYEGYRNYGSKVVYIKNPSMYGEPLIALTESEYMVAVPVENL